MAIDITLGNLLFLTSGYNEEGWKSSRHKVNLGLNFRNFNLKINIFIFSARKYKRI